MNRCPITYEFCNAQEYDSNGLKLLSKDLKNLKHFPFTPKEQRELALHYASKISIQGVQPKLSVKLNVSKEEFETVEKGGTFILKPPHQIYNELPENEDITMRMARLLGIETPLHGMIYNSDSSLTYFIKRFDRLPNNNKVAVEDFSQLLGYSRDTKYESSMEKLIPVIEKHCTFPVLEKIKFFRLTLFNFLVGNEDMHLKNFSLIRRNDKVELSPAYDLLNSSIHLKSKEEIALALRGKKNKLNRSDLFDYFAMTKLGLSTQTLDDEMVKFTQAYPQWLLLLECSFLSPKQKANYKDLLQNRWQRIRF